MWLLSQAWLTGTAPMDGAVHKPACLVGSWGGQHFSFCLSVAGLCRRHVFVKFSSVTISQYYCELGTLLFAQTAHGASVCQ